MTKALAIELAPKVRVNGVAPGAILWPATLENGNDPQVIQARAKVQEKIPLGTLGQLQDIADATYFLASDANYVTGQVIKVDGGRSLS
jgi:pteridine reductase